MSCQLASFPFLDYTAHCSPQPFFSIEINVSVHASQLRVCVCSGSWHICPTLVLLEQIKSSSKKQHYRLLWIHHSTNLTILSLVLVVSEAVEITLAQVLQLRL